MIKQLRKRKYFIFEFLEALFTLAIITGFSLTFAIAVIY